MARVYRRDFGFPGKLFFIVLLALAAGFLWAMADTGRTFADVAKIIAPGEPAPVAGTPQAPLVATPGPPAVPGKPSAVPTVPVPVPHGPVPYSAEKMTALFDEIGEHLKRGRIKEARELVRRQNATLVPASRIEKFRRAEEDLGRYHQLLLETVPGATIDLPQIAELDLRGGGSLIVKNLQESDADVRFETLTGIRSRVARSAVTAIRRPPKEGSGIYVDEELEKQASYRGIRVAKEKTPSGIEMKFSDGPQGAVPGFAYFELADFCARNGRNTRLVALFEEGLKRDPALISTVFEKKAAQFVDIFLYFIAIRAEKDAKSAYDVLSNRYRQSRAYRERVETDVDVRREYANLFDPELAQGPKPGPSAPEGPAPPAPTPEPEPEPDQPPPPPPPGVPPPAGAPPPPAAPNPPPPKPPVDEDPDRGDGAEPTLLPPGSPSKAVDLVKKGDELFKQAMKCVLNSDSQKNPNGWVAENKKALALLTQAFDKCYYPAQEVFEKAKKEIPRSLTRRVRHCQMTKVMCRKRDVAAR